MEDVGNDVTIAIIMVCLACHEVDYLLSITKGGTSFRQILTCASVLSTHGVRAIKKKVIEMTIVF